MSTIKAYAANSPNTPLVPFEYDPGPLGDDEVEVKVTHCGICHSDLAMIDNDWQFSAYPLVAGHEVVGTVRTIGKNAAKRLAVGTRVGIGWHRSSCGACMYCARGKENLCAGEKGLIVGHYGGFADAVRVDAAFAVPIPEAISSEVAGPFFCAGATVFAPMMAFGVQPWMRAAVVGIGGLGHLAVQFLAKFGCEVTAISQTHDKDESVRALGASRFIATRGTDELKKAANSFDFIVSTVFTDMPWADYVNALRPQGRLVILGVPDEALRIPAFPLLGERSVSGGACGSPSETARMLEFAARTGVRPVVEAFAMKDINAALDRVRSGKVRYRVVLAN